LQYPIRSDSSLERVGRNDRHDRTTHPAIAPDCDASMLVPVHRKPCTCETFVNAPLIEGATSAPGILHLPGRELCIEAAVL